VPPTAGPFAIRAGGVTKKLPSALLILTSLIWVAYHLYHAALLGELIGWRSTAADWAQGALVGLGPLAAAIAVVRAVGMRRTNLNGDTTRYPQVLPRARA
jgi:hypothetical protein